MEHEKQLDVAKEFRVSNSQVSQIVRRVLDNRNLLSEMHTAQTKRDVRRSNIGQSVRNIINRDGSVYSIADVRWSCQFDYAIKASSREVNAVMKEDFGLKYCRIKKAAPHLNSARNLILR